MTDETASTLRIAIALLLAVLFYLMRTS